MTLVIRERRQQKALRLSLPTRIPPPSPSSSSLPWCSSHHLIQNLSSLLPSSIPHDNATAPSSSIGNISELEKLSVLGHGNGGVVYKVHHKKNGSLYALKVIRFNPITDIGTPRLEAEILKRMDSPFIVKCCAIFDSCCDNGSGDLSFVMEYMGAGSLHDILQKHRKLPEDVISYVAKSVLEGLNYMHGMQVVHRDIKPSNLLVNNKGEVKIADFGLSHVVEEEEKSVEARDQCNGGTCAYMSPERMDRENWGGENRDEYAGDVWSTGVVVLECLLGHFPLIDAGQRPDWATLMCAICFHDKLEMPETASHEFQSFVMRCLEKDWRKRATVKELLQHPFVNTKCCSSSRGLCDYVRQG